MTVKNRGKRNKQVSYEMEKRVVAAFEYSNIKAIRAWGSNGQAMGQHHEVDVLAKLPEKQFRAVDGPKILYDTKKEPVDIKIQCKYKSIYPPDYLKFTKHVDAVCIQGKHQSPYIVLPLDLFCKLVGD